MFKPHSINDEFQAKNCGTGAVYETSDFYLACYLRCDGFRLLGIRRNGKRSIFQFEDQDDREEITLAFFNNEAKVRPLAYASSIKDFKALIHNL